MEEVCISVKALYDKYGETLEWCDIIVEITDGFDYYDLVVLNEIVCMDGEICKVFHETDNVITLSNNEGEFDFRFNLSREEFNIATFKKKIK